MKRFFLFFLILSMIIFTFSCKKDNSISSTSNSIVGTWAYYENGELNERLQFFDNGSCIIKVIENGQVSMQVGSYVITDDNISITVQTVDQKVVHKGKYTLNKDTLQIDWLSIGFYNQEDKLEKEKEKKVSHLYKKQKQPD